MKEKQICFNKNEIKNIENLINYILDDESNSFKREIISSPDLILQFSTCKIEKMVKLINNFKNSKSDDDLDEIARNTEFHIYSDIVKIQDKIGDF